MNMSEILFFILKFRVEIFEKLKKENSKLKEIN